jgi:hypothetical protein
MPEALSSMLKSDAVSVDLVMTQMFKGLACFSGTIIVAEVNKLRGDQELCSRKILKRGDEEETGSSSTFCRHYDTVRKRAKK